MFQKFLPLLGALALASPASAVTVNMSDFTFGAPVDYSMVGQRRKPLLRRRRRAVPRHPGRHAVGAAALRLSLAEAARRRRSWPGAPSSRRRSASTPATTTTSSPGVAYFGAAEGDRPEPPLHRRAGLRRRQVHLGGDAGRHLGNHLRDGRVVQPRRLDGGTFTGSPEDPAGLAAFNNVNGFLLNLGSYQAAAQHRRPRERRAAGLPGRDDSGAGNVDAVRPRPRRRRPA